MKLVLMRIIFFGVVILVSDLFLAQALRLHNRYQSERNESVLEREREISRRIRVKHPIYHHGFKPNVSNREHTKRCKITLKTNSLGFKDSVVRDVPMTTNQKRIVFIGDSFTEGICLDFEDTFVGIIARELSKHGIGVLNAGRSSYSPIIYWHKIRYLIEEVGLRFDELIVFIDISDLRDEVENYSEDHSGQIIDARVKIDYTASNIVSKSSPSFPNHELFENIKLFLLRNTVVLYPLLYSLRHPGDLVENIMTGWTGSNVSPPTAVNQYPWDKWTVDKKVMEKLREPGLDRMRKYMNRLNQLTRQHGIKMTVAVYPWPAQIWFGDVDSVHVEIWKKWCLDNEVSFLNYFPIFITKNMTYEEKSTVIKKYYLEHDVHFNASGNAVLANYYLDNLVPLDTK